jgi:hypothetical protein
VIVATLAPASRPRSTSPTQGGDPLILPLETVKVLVSAVCTGLGLGNQAAEPAILAGRQAPTQGSLEASEGRGSPESVTRRHDGSTTSAQVGGLKV